MSVRLPVTVSAKAIQFSKLLKKLHDSVPLTSAKYSNKVCVEQV